MTKAQELLAASDGDPHRVTSPATGEAGALAAETAGRLAEGIEIAKAI